MATNLSEKVKAMFLAAPNRVELRLDDLQDADIDALAEEHGAKVDRSVHFNVQYESCPMVFPYVHVYIGTGRSLSLSGLARRATAAEIKEALEALQKKAENCCKPEPAPTYTAKLINGDM